MATSATFYTSATATSATLYTPAMRYTTTTTATYYQCNALHLGHEVAPDEGSEDEEEGVSDSLWGVVGAEQSQPQQ